MLRLRDCLLPLLRLRTASPLPSPINPRAYRLLSTSTSATPAPFSLEDYLVASCGLAPAQALEVSKKASRELSRASGKEEISRPRPISGSNADAIIALLSEAGLSRAHIAAVVSADPLLLRAKVDNIAPRLLALRDRVGLSAPQIARFLVASRPLRIGDVVSRLEFFISFYGSFEHALVALKRNISLLNSGLERRIKPNIALLRQWGVRDIAQLCSNNPRVLAFNPERLKEFLLRAEELGVPPTSGMFKYAVAVVAGNSKEKVAAKLEFFERALRCSTSEVSKMVSKMPTILGYSDETLLRKIEFFKRTLGCSLSEASIALCKKPGILGLSGEILLHKVEFLVNEAMMEPQYIVKAPVVLAMSLEKRLVPRHYVMKILQQNGLLNGNTSFITLSKLGENAFRSKFVDCHKDSVPGLADAYAAARAGIVPSSV